ncbi:MAG: hypothetical protein ACRDPI_05060, partial [Nocardioidaceae bacterium]
MAQPVDARRVRLVADHDEHAHDLLELLVPLAVRGLAAAYHPRQRTFAQTLRAHRTPTGLQLRPEGTNLRYAAMAALGIARLDEADQRTILCGDSLDDLLDAIARQAAEHPDHGAVALSAWALAEVAGRWDARLSSRLEAFLLGDGPMPTVDVSWTLTAALAGSRLTDTRALVMSAANKVVNAQGAGGLFPHWMRPAARDRWRGHVGSFADQVYPLQALARLFSWSGDKAHLEASTTVADRLCALQGAAGQWWWHYDARTGAVVEPYPVYSVHQHAMAPMVLFDLVEAGGTDHAGAVAAGLTWLTAHPEVMEELVSERHPVVWRKVGRREPPKAARAVAAAVTSLA